MPDRAPRRRRRGKPRRRQPGAQIRLYDRRAWRRASAGHLATHPLCVDPYRDHAGQVVAASQVDHIVPHRGDPELFWDPGNWQSLCDHCHGRKSQSEKETD